MTLTTGDLLMWLGSAGVALILFGVIAEYVIASIRREHKKGHHH